MHPGMTLVRNVAILSLFLCPLLSAPLPDDELGDKGPAAWAVLDEPQGIALDRAGNLYIADLRNSRIRRVDAATGRIHTVVGNGRLGCAGDGGPPLTASLAAPAGIAVDAKGNLFVADIGCLRIRVMDVSFNRIVTLVGTGVRDADGRGRFSGDGGDARAASLGRDFKVEVDSKGNLLIADYWNGRIRRLDSAIGIIDTIAGGGKSPPSNGMEARAADLSNPRDLALDSKDNIYLSNDHHILKLDSHDGKISLVAGSGKPAFMGDGGPAALSSLSSPAGLMHDPRGNLFVADQGNHRIRRIDALSGNITTVAGNGGPGFSGDGGPATSALLRHPADVAVDAKGNLLIADTGNNRIRKVEASTGRITTIVGGGSPRHAMRDINLRPLR